MAVTQEYEDEKRHVHSNRLLLILLQKKLTALSDIFFNFWRLCTWLLEILVMLYVHFSKIVLSFLKFLLLFMTMEIR